MYVSETIQVVLESLSILRVIESRLKHAPFLVDIHASTFATPDRVISHSSARFVLLTYRQGQRSFRVEVEGELFIVDPASRTHTCKIPGWVTAYADAYEPLMYHTPRPRLPPLPKLRVTVPERDLGSGTLILRADRCRFETDPRPERFHLTAPSS